MYDYCKFSDDPYGSANATFYFGDKVALETTVANGEIKPKVYESNKIIENIIK